MNKDDRAALLRSRFATKAGSRVWVSKGRKLEVPYQRPAVTFRNDSKHRWDDGLSTNAASWIYQPDPRRELKVGAQQPGKEESAITKTAKAMYEYNRMEWGPEGKT